MKRFIITMELKDIIKWIILAIIIILFGILIYNMATGIWTLDGLASAIQNIFGTIIDSIIQLASKIYEHNKESIAYLFGGLIIIALFAAILDQ